MSPEIARCQWQINALLSVPKTPLLEIEKSSKRWTRDIRRRVIARVKDAKNQAGNNSSLMDCWTGAGKFSAVGMRHYGPIQILFRYEFNPTCRVLNVSATASVTMTGPLWPARAGLVKNREDVFRNRKQNVQTNMQFVVMKGRLFLAHIFIRYEQISTVHGAIG